MNEHDRFDDALDAAIDLLQSGRSIDRAAPHPDASGTRALLEVAEALRAAPPAPASTRLADNYAIVRAAVERAQMSAARPELAPAPRPTWWRRRLGFASLSVPAGVAALVLAAGVSGAAASVMTGAAPSMADLVHPDWVEDIVPGGEHGKSADAPGRQEDGTPANAVNPAAPGGDAPGSENRPTHVEVTGTVSDVNGNTFTLTNGDSEWKVNIDANTDLSGEILEGATAEVSGDVTAEKNLHADSVSASGGEAAPAPGRPEDPGQPGDPGKPEDPGPPGDPGGRGQKTPPGPRDHDEIEENDDGGSRKP